ncbi:protein NYNRIN-like [Grus japonensis]|uniref:Protein NYNRIN-like n=1 Tax=Grus japonensis TaxID=30415 RepID=A0ABC9YBR7_GRUJA
MIGWCRLWILNYGLYVKPLYEALKESKDRYLIWTPECHKSFKELKKALMMAPALGLPDLTKPFELFVHERQHLALGVLAQQLGSWKRPVGYFSKQLDTVSKGWPGCLRAMAATVLLIQEARKLTMGQKIVVYVPHMVITVLEQKGGHWLSPSRTLKYQVVLLEQDDVELKATAIVNPAMFLTTENPTEKLEHDCLVTIEQVYSSRPDLKDEPLKDPDLELFTDGSSFVQEGRRIAEYAVVTIDKVLESGTLPANTSAQKAELVALKQALRMAEGKRVNIWTDSKYAFGVIHAHGAIWKERGLLSAQGSPIKYKEEVLQLLQDVQKPKEVAAMHCKAHQFGQTAINIGNRLADKAAKEAAERGLNHNGTILYPSEHRVWARKMNEKWQTVNLESCIVRKQQGFVCEGHQGRDGTYRWAHDRGVDLTMDAISQVIHECETCAAIKRAKQVKPLWYGGRWLKYKYGEAWQIDYITLPQTRQGKRYVLTMVEETTGWLETCPVPHATARNTILALEKQVLWQHGTPERIVSDKTHFQNNLIDTWAKEHGH